MNEAKDKLKEVCEEFSRDIEKEIDAKIAAAVAKLEEKVYEEFEDLRGRFLDIADDEPEMVKMLTTAIVDGLSKPLIDTASRLIGLLESQEMRIAALEKM